MNYTNIKNLHKQLATNSNKAPVKVPVKEYNDEKITFNTANKLTTLAFIKPILKMVNYTESWIQQYKYVGILYNRKTGEYSHKVNYEDYVDLMIGAHSKNTYYLSLETGGIKMIDKIPYDTLSNSTKDYIKTGLSSKKTPNFVYTLGEKNIEIDDLVRDDPDYVYTLTQICDKEEYLGLMIEAINTLPDEERHKIINQIKP